MKYLTNEAAIDLHDLIYWSYANRVTSHSQFLHRLEAMLQMIKPSNSLGNSIRDILEENEWKFQDEWFDQESDEDNQPSPENGVSRGGGEDSHDEEEESEEDDDPLIIHFHPGSKTGLSKWFFYIGDPDNFPSVPHGHFNKHPKHKLDPYLGWEYKGSKQVNRIKRKHIILLWNEDKFRSFAKGAILQFITDNPNFQWRIPFDPRRLPRRRKR